LAFIAVEQLMKEHLASRPVDVCAPECFCWLSRDFLQPLSGASALGTTTSGTAHRIQAVRG
jgi:hypothetical protein